MTSFLLVGVPFFADQISVVNKNETVSTEGTFWRSGYLQALQDLQPDSAARLKGPMHSTGISSLFP